MTAAQALGRLARWAAGTAVVVALAWLASAGLRDPLEQLYVAGFSGFILFATLTLDPALIRERVRPGPGGVDRSMPAIARGAVLAVLALGFLDGGRFAWSEVPASGLRNAALAASALSVSWALWAVAVNPFWSPVVRIQTERGHRLITAGPYRFVRHPGYAGILVAIPGSALALGSWWALLPAGVFVAIVLRRVAIEDAYLTEHLEGYRAYAASVRHRLIPGLW